MKLIHAKFKSNCNKCNNVIKKYELIYYNTETKKVYCLTCSDTFKQYNDFIPDPATIDNENFCNNNNI
jgi:hypothetical protein